MGIFSIRCLGSETMWTFLCLILFLSITGGQGQNPCEPNPCGKNTRCLTQSNSGRSVISCKCLPGFRQGEAFIGCDPVAGTALIDQIEDSIDLSSATQTSTTTT